MSATGLYEATRVVQGAGGYFDASIDDPFDRGRRFSGAESVALDNIFALIGHAMLDSDTAA